MCGLWTDALVPSDPLTMLSKTKLAGFSPKARMPHGYSMQVYKILGWIAIYSPSRSRRTHRVLVVLIVLSSCSSFPHLNRHLLVLLFFLALLINIPTYPLLTTSRTPRCRILPSPWPRTRSKASAGPKSMLPSSPSPPDIPRPTSINSGATQTPSRSGTTRSTTSSSPAASKVASRSAKSAQRPSAPGG